MAAVAVATLTCCANSHPFQERRVALTEPIKIGRSVAQLRPGQTNAIFDCKVLSRNHALLWYDNGKFFLQDTKSSNGTFVNSQRLSRGSEESDPFELFSNDTVQFGVDVMENSKKVTHSCIIATIQLFHPDGREAVRAAEVDEGMCSSSCPSGATSAVIRTQELYQLAQYIQEALHREQMLENKLAILQNLVASTQAAVSNGWQALIDEDRLLSRLGTLENQLSVYSKNQPEAVLKQELITLYDEKAGYEGKAKESLRLVLEEKLDSVKKLSELERTLCNSEDECSHLQLLYETSKAELQRLAEINEDQTHDMQTLKEKLQELEKAYSDEREEMCKERTSLQVQIEEVLKHEEVLQAKIESLQADNDFMNEQLNNVKAKLEVTRKVSTESMRIPEYISRAVQADLVNLLDLNLLQTNIDDNDYNEDDGVEIDKSTSADGEHLQVEDRLSAEHSVNFITDMQFQETERQLGAENSQTTITDDFSALKDYKQKLEVSEKLIAALKTQLEKAQLEAVSREADTSVSRDKLCNASEPGTAISPLLSAVANGGNIDSMQQEMQRESAKNRAEFAALKDECAYLRQRILDIENEMKKSHMENVQLKAEYSLLQESYRELEQTRDLLKDTQATCQSNLTDAQKEADKTKEELVSALTELAKLRDKFAQHQTSMDAMTAELSSTLDEYSLLSYQTKALSTCSIIPLIVLVFAILIAFYPFISTFTLTSNP